MKKTKTLPQLIKETDKYFSKYVRLRDCEYANGEWVGNCITCDRRLCVVKADGKWGLGADAGHFISRGHKGLRWSDLNVNLQCRHCNIWRDKAAMLDAYKQSLDLKYGRGTHKRLAKEGQETHKPARAELEQIIADAKEYVSWTLSHPNGV